MFEYKEDPRGGERKAQTFSELIDMALTKAEELTRTMNSKAWDNEERDEPVEGEKPYFEGPLKVYIDRADGSGVRDQTQFSHGKVYLSKNINGELVVLIDEVKTNTWYVPLANPGRIEYP